MPLPKDPEKLAAYKAKMSMIAKEKGYSKWMTGRKLSQPMLDKMRQAQIEIGNCPEERARRSARAKQAGYSKWMKGRSAYPKVIAHLKARKGKTYAELYGAQAEEERRKRSEGNKKTKQGQRPAHLLALQAKIAAARKGKSYAQIYGEAAVHEVQKRQSSLRATHATWPKTEQRPKHGSDYHYSDWRASVFLRDNFTCQICGKRGGQLNAHHIQPWATHPELRYETSNGLTVCAEPCHLEITRAQKRKKP